MKSNVALGLMLLVFQHFKPAAVIMVKRGPPQCGPWFRRPGMPAVRATACCPALRRCAWPVSCTRTWEHQLRQFQHLACSTHRYFINRKERSVLASCQALKYEEQLGILLQGKRLSYRVLSCQVFLPRLLLLIAVLLRLTFDLVRLLLGFDKGHDLHKVHMLSAKQSQSGPARSCTRKRTSFRITSRRLLSSTPKCASSCCRIWRSARTTIPFYRQLRPDCSSPLFPVKQGSTCSIQAYCLQQFLELGDHGFVGWRFFYLWRIGLGHALGHHLCFCEW